MKRSIYCILVLVMAIMAVGCSGQSPLEAAIAEANKTLPQPAGQGITFDKIEYDGSDVVFVYTFSSQQYTDAQISEAALAVKDVFSRGGVEETDEIRKFIELAHEAGAPIRVLLKSTTGYAESFTLSH